MKLWGVEVETSTRDIIHNAILSNQGKKIQSSSIRSCGLPPSHALWGGEASSGFIKDEPLTDIYDSRIMIRSTSILQVSYTKAGYFGYSSYWFLDETKYSYIYELVTSKYGAPHNEEKKWFFGNFEISIKNYFGYELPFRLSFSHSLNGRQAIIDAKDLKNLSEEAKISEKMKAEQNRF